MSDLSIDPREMRRRMLNSGHPGCSLDGTPSKNPLSSNCAQMLARKVAILCEREGYSGEDTMTVLAYAALLHYEKLTDDFIYEAASKPLQSSFSGSGFFGK